MEYLTHDLHCLTGDTTSVDQPGAEDTGTVDMFSAMKINNQNMILESFQLHLNLQSHFQLHEKEI